MSGQNSVHDTLSESETFSTPSSSSERKMHDMLKVNIRKANKFVQPLSSYSKVTPNKNFSRNKTCDVNNILQTLKKFGEKYSLKNVTKTKTIANKKTEEDAISDDESVLEIKNKSLSDLETGTGVDYKNAGKYSHVHNTIDKLTDNENDIDSSIKTNLKFNLEQPYHTEIPINKLQEETNVNDQNSNKIKKSSHSVLSTKQKIDPKNEIYKGKPSISSSDSIPEDLSDSYEDGNNNSDFKNLAEVHSLNSEINGFSAEHSVSRSHNFVTYQNKHELETNTSVGDHCDIAKQPVNMQHNSHDIGSKIADEFVESPHQFEKNNSGPHSVEKFVGIHDLYKIYTIEDLFDKDEEENFKEQTNFYNKTDDNIVVMNKLSKKDKIVNKHSADEILDEDSRLKSEEEIAEELDEVTESEIGTNVLENSGDSILVDSSVKTNSSYDEIMNVATSKEESVVSESNYIGENVANETEQSSRIINDADGNTVSTITDEIITHHSSLEEHSSKETLMNIRFPSSFRSKHKIIITKSESDDPCSVSADLVSESGNRKKFGAVENNVKIQVNDSDDEQESLSDETLVQSNELAESEEADDKQGNKLDLKANKCCSVSVQTENINSMLRPSNLFLNATDTRQRDIEGSSSLFENTTYLNRYFRRSTEFQEMSTSDDIVFIGMLKHQIELVKHCMNSQEKMYNAYCDSVKNITRGYTPVTLEDTRQYIRSRHRSRGYVWSQ